MFVKCMRMYVCTYVCMRVYNICITANTKDSIPVNMHWIYAEWNYKVDTGTTDIPRLVRFLSLHKCPPKWAVWLCPSLAAGTLADSPIRLYKGTPAYKMRYAYGQVYAYVYVKVHSIVQTGIHKLYILRRWWSLEESCVCAPLYHLQLMYKYTVHGCFINEHSSCNEHTV